MINAIHAGEYVKQLLLSSGFTSDQIFAIVAGESSVLPYVTYARTSSTFQDTKDGGSSAQVVVSLWTADYDEGILRIETIIEKFFDFVNVLSPSASNRIDVIRADSADEGIDEGAPSTFRQTVMFTFQFAR